MSLPVHPIPAPGFRLVSGKRNPPDDGTQYQVQFRNGWIDPQHKYTAKQLIWKHGDQPYDFDVVAVRNA